MLLLLLNQNVLVNTELLYNPSTDRKLEYDFYILGDDNKMINLVIEVDGKHHKQPEQKQNDKTKRLLSELSDITLISIDTDKNVKYISELYEKLKKYFKDIHEIDFNIELKDILPIFETLNDNIKTKQFSYEINRDYIETHAVIDDNIEIPKYIKYNETVQKQIKESLEKKDTTNTVVNIPNTPQT